MADLPKGDAAFSPRRTSPPPRQPRRSSFVLERDGDSIRPESFMLDTPRFIKNLFREGNHQRGLDADKLDSHHASDFGLLAGDNTWTGDNHFTGGVGITGTAGARADITADNVASPADFQLPNIANATLAAFTTLPAADNYFVTSQGTAGNQEAISPAAALTLIGAQPLDTQLTSLAALSYAGNTLKVVRVNAGETDFELATISSGLSAASTTEQLTGTEAGKASTPDSVAALWEHGGTYTAVAGVLPSFGEGGVFNIGAGDFASMSFTTDHAGRCAKCIFNGVSVITHNATTLDLPNAGANITTAAGDTAEFESDGAGNFTCLWYQRYDGTALASGASTALTAAATADADNRLFVSVGAARAMEYVAGLTLDPANGNLVTTGNATVANLTTTGETVLGPNSTTINNASQGGSGTVENYTGFDGDTVWEVDVGDANQTLSGVANMARGEHKYVYVRPSSSFSLLLANQDAFSSAGNRINTGTGATFTIAPGTGAYLECVYNGTDNEISVKGCADRIPTFSAGVPAYTAPNGSLCIDTSNGDQYDRIGGAWVRMVKAADLAAYATSAAVASGYQPLDTQLTSLAGLAYAGNALKVVRVNAGETAFEVAAVGTGDLLAANNLSELTASAATARANIGLTIGTHVQAYDADLTTWAGLTPSANAQSLVTAANYAAMRALLDLEAGTDFYSIAAADAAFQPKDADLTTIAGLTATTDNFIVSVASAWASRTPAQVRATLDLEAGTDFPSQATFDDHSARHESGGADAIKIDDLAAGDDNTDLNVSTTKHGLTPKLPNDATKYLDGTGAYSVPSGSGAPLTAILANAYTVTTSMASTGLSVTLAASTYYLLEGYLDITRSGAVTNAIDFDGGACTVTAMDYSLVREVSGTSAPDVIAYSTTALATDAAPGSSPAQKTYIKGWVQVNAAGTFILRMQRTGGTSTTLGKGSWIRLTAATSV